MSTLVLRSMVILGIGTSTAAATGDALAPPVRIEAAGAVIDHGEQWGHCGPTIADVDGDGKLDLVVGDFSGKFRVYRNTGTNKEPRYAAGSWLQAGGQEAKVPIY